MTNFKDIFRNYNHWNKLWFDVGAVFPYEIFASSVICNPFMHSAPFRLRLPRVLFCLRDVPLTFGRWENSLRANIVRVRILKLVMYIYFITNLFACLLYQEACAIESQR